MRLSSFYCDISSFQLSFYYCVPAQFNNDVGTQFRGASRFPFAALFNSVKGETYVYFREWRKSRWFIVRALSALKRVWRVFK